MISSIYNVPCKGLTTYNSAIKKYMKAGKVCPSTLISRAKVLTV